MYLPLSLVKLFTNVIQPLLQLPYHSVLFLALTLVLFSLVLIRSLGKSLHQLAFELLNEDLLHLDPFVLAPHFTL